MSNGKFSVFDFAPKVVNNKSRYRDEETKKKLTYNFVTDPKMKRGHNFGVVYVTNSSMEEDSIHNKRRQGDPIPKATETTMIEKKRKVLEIDVPKPPKGRENLGINTSPVASTIRPKPLTFEMGVQIDMYVDRPQTPLFWPQKTGIDVDTQIEDGDLFHFDDEVEPILNVLTSKVLEQARMELLEEEEIKEMKMKQREFEEIRNRELTEVQKLEDKEAREVAEKNRRVAQKKIEKENRIINQKKLFSRTFAKEYLSKIKNNTLINLTTLGVFRSPMESQFQNNLLNSIYENALSIHNNDFTVLNKLNQTFENDFTMRKRNLHKAALDKEKNRLKDLERQKLEEIERKKQEIIMKKAEATRLKKEKELMQLKLNIEEEFIKKVEFVDLPENVFDINGYFQKKSYAAAIGGYFGQFTITISYLNKLYNDYMNEERLLKVLEIFLPKLPAINIIYSNEDLEFYKTLDTTGVINAIEDILKLDESLTNEIFNQISQKLLLNDEILNQVLNFYSDKISNSAHNDYQLLMITLMKLMKTSDPLLIEKIKFIMKDPTVLDDREYAAISEIFPIQIPNSFRVSENTTKKSKEKKNQAAKITHDPSFIEKIAILPTISEKMKILLVNYPFEKMLRSNIIECMNKIQKFEGELEIVKEQFEQFYYDEFYEPFMTHLTESLKKERIVHDDVRLPDNI